MQQSVSNSLNAKTLSDYYSFIPNKAPQKRRTKHLKNAEQNTSKTTNRLPQKHRFSCLVQIFTLPLRLHDKSMLRVLSWQEGACPCRRKSSERPLESGLLWSDYRTQLWLSRFGCGTYIVEPAADVLFSSGSDS